MELRNADVRESYDILHGLTPAVNDDSIHSMTTFDHSKETNVRSCRLFWI